MTDLELVLALTCGVAIVALTVAVLGLTRRVTDVRMTLSGHGGVAEDLRADAGRLLPDGLVEELGPQYRSHALLVFASAHCEVCLTLLDGLAADTDLPVVVCPTGGDQGQLERAVDPRLAVIAGDVSESAARELHIVQTPLVLVQRDGVILGHARGDSAQSAAQVRAFIRTFQVEREQEETHA
jgi:hypothetical protein